MRKEKKKSLAIILSLAMVIGLMPGWTSEVKAEGADYSFEEEYTMDGGMKVYKINEENLTRTFNDITIPSDGLLEITVDGVTAKSINIAAGGSLTILGDGRLTVESITAAPGAHMFLGNKDNKPSCVESLWDITEGANNITGDGEWVEFDFEYRSDDVFRGWGVMRGGGPSDPSEYSVMVDGFEEGAVEISYCISTGDDGTYGEPIVVAEPIPTDEGGFEAKFNIVPENLAEGDSVKKVKINVAIKDDSKRIYSAFRGAGWSETHTDEISTNDQHYGVTSYEVEFDQNLTMDKDGEAFIWHEVHVALNNYRQGSQDTANLISNYLYAYGDLNSNSSVDETDMKIGLATELSSRFFWYAGGIVDGGTFDIYKPQDLYDPTNEGASRIDVLSAGTITAKDNFGADVSVDRYTYRISLGVTEDGTQVSTSGDVYALPTGFDLLIWTGSEWFVRNSKTDITKFYEDTSDHTRDDEAICVKANFNPAEIKIGGNGCTEGAESINPDGDDVYCTYLMNYMYDGKADPNDGSGRFIDYYEKFYNLGPALSGITGKLCFVNPGKTYVVVNSEGETKAVYGINSEQVDRIAQTGSSAEKKSTDVFVGARFIHIEKVGDAISDLHITNVVLKDASMSDGVIITNPAPDDFIVEFKSNFYDTVPLLITYGDESVKELTINRVGLVITKEYLHDPEGDGVAEYVFRHGGTESEGGVAKCNYNYSAGQQIIVYATYYHPTYDRTGGSGNISLYVTYADGTHKVFSDRIVSQDSGSVKMTDFVIGFESAKDEAGNPRDNITMPAMNVLVLNNGYDDATTFSGTQVGAGKGVYWDGHIEWNY